MPATTFKTHLTQKTHRAGDVFSFRFERPADYTYAAGQWHEIVIAGPDGWGQGAFEAALVESPHRDRIVRKGYVTPVDRRDLLAGATVFAYPSRYEGFGLPPLEAMAAGVAVVAEHLGERPGARLVDPLDDEALADAMRELLDDDAARAALIARGRAVVARYDWSTTAERFASLYRAVA